MGFRKLCQLHNICWHISRFIISLMRVPYLTGLFSKDVGLDLVWLMYVYSVYWLEVGTV